MTRITHVHLVNVRCHERFDIDLGPGINVLVGGNGVGKTSVLESVAVVLTGRSPRASAAKGMIRHGETSMRIELDLSPFPRAAAAPPPQGGPPLAVASPPHGEPPPSAEQSRPYGVAAGFSVWGERRFFLNGGSLDDGRRLREIAHVRLFLPDDLRLVKGGPAPRRDLLDSLAALADPEHEFRVDDYRQALEQRNSLLRRGRVGAENGPWERILAKEGRAIVGARIDALTGFTPFFAGVSSKLGPAGAAPVKLLYRTNVDGLSEEDYRQGLAAARTQDCRRTFTHLGPHRDDVRFLRDGVDLREHGSQGEQRAIVLALLLAEVEWLRAEGRAKDRPVLLLLDDVLSELDEERRQVLVSMLGEGAQSLVTTTDIHCLHLDRLAEVDVIEVGGARDA